METITGLRCIENSGYYKASQLVPSTMLDSLVCALESYSESVHARVRGGQAYAMRNILHAVPELALIAEYEPVFSSIEAVLGEDARPTKAILFDKTVTANWNLGWHQDLTISVNERKDIAGWGPWSTKVGIPHVQPPVNVMEGILSARIHIDDCGEDNGALLVIPGSHALGKLSDADISGLKESGAEVVCACKRGDVLFMRPLILHASRRCVRPGHRRVLHIEYSANQLPEGLSWGG